MRLFLLLFLLLPTPAIAAYPALSAYINDYAEMLSVGDAAALEQKLTELNQQESTQIVLLTVPSLNGTPIEEYALGIAEKEGLGQKGKDNGALLLIAQKERKMRIETGLGLENRLTDLQCGRIIRNIITPRFKKGDYSGGITAGLDAMIGAVKGEYSSIHYTKKNSAEDLVGFASFMLVVLLAIGNIFRKHKGRAGTAAAIAAPVFGMLFFGMEMPLLLLLVPGGFFLGFIASLMSSSMKRSAHSGSRRHYRSLGSRDAHSRSSRRGGFHGGGGSFGGGGASGSW